LDFLNNILAYFHLVVVNPISAAAIFSLLFTFFLLLLSAFMSSSEVAFFALTPSDKNELNPQQKTDAIILELKETPEKLLATILIGNNLVNVAVIIFATYTTHLFYDFSASPVLGFVIQTIIITFFLLLFGEIMPKIYASHYPLRLARFSAKPLQVLQRIFRPVIYLLVHSTHFINKRLAKYTHKNISIDELSHALELTAKHNDEDKDILEGIIKFGNIDVVQIMTPRTDMVDIDIKLSFNKVLEIIVDSGYSRLPVYLGSKDSIRGVLYVKDLLSHLDKGDNFKWQTLIRRAFFVPETKKIDDLLADFQLNKVHIAIVVDEFGGTSGLVTMEDVLEEIFGDIDDEYDEEEKLYTQIDNHTFLFEAKILLNDFYKVSKIDETLFLEVADNVDTLAGLILQLVGEIPIKNQKVRFENYLFEVLSVDRRRIKKVKFSILPKPEEN
jgi:gliding motility-associated protein GldE